MKKPIIPTTYEMYSKTELVKEGDEYFWVKKVYRLDHRKIIRKARYLEVLFHYASK